MRTILIALLLASRVLAQEPPGLMKTITINAKESEIRDLVMTIGRLGGFNVMVEPKIRGKMPLMLNNVTCAEALKLVAGITGNKVGMVSGVVIFSTEETLKFMQGPARSALYQLRYAKSEDISGIINKVFAKDLQSIHHGPTNKVLVVPK
jgi:type II secretory pathway component GspD/PulD (secretin)